MTFIRPRSYARSAGRAAIIMALACMTGALALLPSPATAAATTWTAPQPGHGLPERIKNSDKQNARVEHDAALQKAVVSLAQTYTDFFKEFSDNPSFKKWVADMMFGVTYQPPAATGG